MGKTWFTSDTHFGHALTTRLRGFETSQEQDDTLIASWNAVVRPGDEVWHLGDFGHRASGEHLRHVFQKLNGNKHLIRGNHDSHRALGLSWASVHDLHQIAVDGQRIVLCHYGLRSWPASHRGAIMLFGHSHGRLPGYSNTMDVGVDAVGFAPIDINQVRARLAELPAFRIEDAGEDQDEGLDSVPGVDV
jgi:calcineurin-like phosphoesterase family protein